MTCTFFGNRDASGVCAILREILIDLIENRKVDPFLVGNNGRFDHMVIKELTVLQQRYAHIHWSVVLAYMPHQKNAMFPTIYPEGMEMVPRKYAIARRNEWMIKQADFVVAYTRYTTGGAAKYRALAEKKGKTVIDLPVI